MGRSRVAATDPHRHAEREAGSGRFVKKPPATDPPPPSAAGGTKDPTTRPPKGAAAPPPRQPDPGRAGSGTGAGGETGPAAGTSWGRRIWSRGLGALRGGSDG